MKGSINLIFSDKFIKYSVIFSVVLIILQGVLVGFFLSSLPPLVPILNSQPWGISRLYPSHFILLILPVVIVIFLLNNFLSATFYKRNVLIARILVFNSLLFTFLALLAFIQIVFLVF